MLISGRHLKRVLQNIVIGVGSGPSICLCPSLFYLLNAIDNYLADRLLPKHLLLYFTQVSVR